jgi:DNA-binding transcriptional ArsR family regulator
MSSTPAVRITWDKGTAYDFFASLFVLHNAESVGLRRAWAAGVRNRLMPEHREIAEDVARLISVPVDWVGSLPEPRDCAALFDGLDALPDSGVLSSLLDSRLTDSQVVAGVSERGRYTSADVDALASDTSLGMSCPASRDEAERLLWLFSDAQRSGRLLRETLQEYYERFFREEEGRIRDHLERAQERARERAKNVSLVDLVEELSGGLRLLDLEQVPRVMLIPSFWAGPLVLFETLADGTHVILFSARPREVSLIPGDPVPDALILSLQAVSDPTRLRILRLLADAPHNQVEIARELRLRPPTITHHLKILRMANMVRLTEGPAGEKRYDVREARLRELPDDLVRFVGFE